MFSSLFGKKPAPAQETKTTTTTNDVTHAIMKLRDSIDIIEKKIAANEKKITALEAEARECVKTNNKPKAMTILKKKKLLTDANTNFEGQKMNLELQCMEIENLNMNKEIITSFQTSTNLIKKFHKENNIDKVEDMMDNFMENMDDFKQVTASLSRPIISMDESELESELEGFLQEETDRKLLEVNVPTSNVADQLPSVPDTKLPTNSVAVESEDDRELRALMEGMNS